MTRPAVAKHLGVLADANLVNTVWDGREKRHYLNPVPIQQVHERWTRHYDRGRVAALTTLKNALEETTMTDPEFVYTIYLVSTAEQVWRALTEPEFTRQWWGVAVESDWQVGSVVTHRFEDATEPFFGGGEVLECDPPRRLTYTAGFVPTAKDPTPDTRLTTATFELEQTGEIVKLTVTSVDPREQMRVHVNEGWVLVVANLKSFLETGKPMPV